MQSTRTLEQLALTDVLLEDLRERELLDCTLPVVACRRLDGNMCGCTAFEILNVEEALTVDGG